MLGLQLMELGWLGLVLWVFELSVLVLVWGLLLLAMELMWLVFVLLALAWLVVLMLVVVAPCMFVFD